MYELRSRTFANVSLSLRQGKRIKNITVLLIASDDIANFHSVGDTGLLASSYSLEILDIDGSLYFLKQVPYLNGITKICLQGRAEWGSISRGIIYGERRWQWWERRPVRIIKYISQGELDWLHGLSNQDPVLTHSRRSPFPSLPPFSPDPPTTFYLPTILRRLFTLHFWLDLSLFLFRTQD